MSGEIPFSPWDEFLQNVHGCDGEQIP